MGDLSRQTGVPVPTIKYYLREGLLAPGERTSPNQMRYDDRHVRRLRLIRALIDIGGLSVAATQTVLSHIDAPQHSLHDVLGKAQYALTPTRDPADDEAIVTARTEVTHLINRRGWQIHPKNPAQTVLASLLATLRDLGRDDLIDLLDQYASAADHLAAIEVDLIGRRTDLDAIIEGVVLGTVLGDAMLAAVRRLAQENASNRYLTPDDQTPKADDTNT
jgi:DNA-binding transcriptional MerR regulator